MHVELNFLNFKKLLLKVLRSITLKNSLVALNASLLFHCYEWPNKLMHPYICWARAWN